MAEKSRDYFTLREAVALLDHSTQNARWLLHRRALEEVGDGDGHRWERVPKDAPVAYLRAKTAPPDYSIFVEAIEVV